MVNCASVDHFKSENADARPSRVRCLAVKFEACKPSSCGGGGGGGGKTWTPLRPTRGVVASTPLAEKPRGQRGQPQKQRQRKNSKSDSGQPQPKPVASSSRDGGKCRESVAVTPSAGPVSSDGELPSGGTGDVVQQGRKTGTTAQS